MALQCESWHDLNNFQRTSWESLGVSISQGRRGPSQLVLDWRLALYFGQTCPRSARHFSVKGIVSKPKPAVASGELLHFFPAGWPGWFMSRLQFTLLKMSHKAPGIWTDCPIFCWAMVIAWDLHLFAFCSKGLSTCHGVRCHRDSILLVFLRKQRGQNKSGPFGLL